MIMKKNILLFLFAFPIVLVGQQLTERSPFSETSFIWNPAMTAPWDYWEIGANYRQEWLGFEDAPSTASVQVAYPFVDEHMSMGGFFLHDNASPIRLNSAGFSYAYRLQLGRSGHQLALGLNATLTQVYVNGMDIVTNDPDDALMPGAANNKVTPNVGFGVYYTSYGTDDFDRSFVFAGAAVNQILPMSVLLDDFDGMADLQRTLHGNAILGTRIIEGDIYIQPAIWINYSANNITQGNLSIKIERDEVFWAGLNYATTQTIAMQGGFIIENDFTQDGSLRIGTLASYNIGQFGKFRGLGFEFYIAYRFKI